MSQLGQLLAGLHERSVRFVAIGVWGANYYADGITELFATKDKDLFVPPDPDNLLKAWEACDAAGLELLSGHEPLDRPRDMFLARQVVQRRALTRATDGRRLWIDWTLVMAGFDFEEVWSQRRMFRARGVQVPIARLTHIVESKAAAGRPKDRLFLVTHEEMLLDLRRRHGETPPGT